MSGMLRYSEDVGLGVIGSYPLSASECFCSKAINRKISTEKTLISVFQMRSGEKVG